MELSKQVLVDMIKKSTIDDLKSRGFDDLKGKLIDPGIGHKDVSIDFVFKDNDESLVLIIIPEIKSTPEIECYNILKSLAMIRSKYVIHHLKMPLINTIILGNNNDLFLPLLSLTDNVSCLNYNFDLKDGVMFFPSYPYYSSNEVNNGGYIQFINGMEKTINKYLEMQEIKKVRK